MSDPEIEELRDKARWPASCGRARPAAPGSLISAAPVPSPTSTFAGQPTKAHSSAAPSPQGDLLFGDDRMVRQTATRCPPLLFFRS